MNIVYVLYKLIDFYELLIFAACILSWFPTNGILGDVYEALRTITEPFVGIFRRLIPSVGGAGMRLDFSPMIAVVVLDLLKRVIFGLLF